MSRICTYEGCNKEYYARGFCSSHYMMMKSKGALKTERKCSVPDCEKSYYAKGYCRHHLHQINKRGCIYKSKAELNDVIDYKDCIGIVLLSEDKKVVGICLVDKEDYLLVREHKWSMNKGKKTKYAVSRTNGKKIEISKLLLKTDKIIDHVDGNGLNNRRSNLRAANNQQNSQNRGMRKDNTSGYKGVTFSEREKKYIAAIGHNGKLYRLGSFSSAKEAAKAYDKAAIAHFGKFARTNHMEGRI